MVKKSGPEARKTKTNDKTEHPYAKFEDTKLWSVLDKAIDDLVENRDIKETTNRRYIVGYLCMKIEESGLEKSS